jgi:hypothetical protein
VAKHQAKVNRVTASQNKQAKPRIPWSDEEENALSELIQTFGVSWSELKSHDVARGDDQQLARRSAEDMRFKARNMKLTMME